MKVKRVWKASDVRDLCIKYNYYTRGECNEYINLLDIMYQEPTPERVVEVAEDIVDHSDLSRYGQSRKENIESVCFQIEKEVINTFYTL